MLKRITFAGLATALLMGGCRDSLSPERRGPGTPAFSHVGPGIALDQQNSSLNESGTVLKKGFNPTNPHRGSAIIATFFWVGPATITNVTDHLADVRSTPVGNTYRLVQDITSDGISMATYVATNVQNFPDPCCASNRQDSILVVRADLSEPVVDGGVMISAWTGVHPEYAQALGENRSAFGFGSTDATIADAGAIAVGTGALVYGVTMSNGRSGVSFIGPAEFKNLTNGSLSDAFIVADGEYAVPASAGSVHPRWRWFFQSQSDWLATVLTLNPAAAQPPPDPPRATHLAFTGQPSDVTVGGTISPPVEVTALDATGNPVPSFSGTITMGLGANPGGGTLSGTTTAAAVNGVATFPDLSIAEAGNGYALVATASGLSDGTSAAFNVTTPVATQLAFTVQPTDATAGSAISPPVEVTVLDAAGNPVPTFRGPIAVALGANPLGGTLAGTKTVTAVNGVATFSDLSIAKAANGYVLQAAAAGLTGATSPTFSIIPGPPARVVFTIQPSRTEAGRVISPAVQVAALDELGNVASSHTGSVTVALGSNPPGGTLLGTKTVTAVSGVATFGDLSIRKAGSGYTLRATTSGLPEATSAAFAIIPGPAKQLVFTVQPSNALPHPIGTIQPAVKVTGLDAHGNWATSFDGIVTIAIGRDASLLGNARLHGATAVSAVSGVATFSGLSIDQIGSGYALVTRAPGLTSALSAPFNIGPGL